ncbi:hypothetical protein FKM82_020025 [Ascaphus truei]
MRLRWGWLCLAALLIGLAAADDDEDAEEDYLDNTEETDTEEHKVYLEVTLPWFSKQRAIYASASSYLPCRPEGPATR